MAIEENKIKDLIEEYEGYQEQCECQYGAVARGRAGLYRTVIRDLEKLLPRKTLGDLNIDDYGELTGIVVEFDGKEGVLLGGGFRTTLVFTLADKQLNWCEPDLVFPLSKDRVWDERGVISF